MGCPSLADLPITLPGPTPPPNTQILASEFDYNSDVGDFTGILNSTVGNAGDPSDGFDVIFSLVVDAVTFLQALFNSISPLLDGLDETIPELNAFDTTAIVAAADSGAASTAQAVSALGTLLGVVPSPGGGTPTGTGTPAGCSAGVPQGFTDCIDFGTIQSINGVGNSPKRTYVYEPNATKPYTLLGVAQQGVLVFRFSYGSFPVNVSVGKPPSFQAWVQNATPGDYTGEFDVRTTEPGGGGRVYLHVRVT